MSVKKTGSPLSSGAESLEPLDGTGKLHQSGKVDKNFETALAEITGQLEQTGTVEQTNSPTRSAFQQIAASANLDSPEDAKTAVRESAHFLINSRLKENLKNSEQGKKISEDLSNYICNDPLLYRKILGILQRIK